MPFTPGNEGAGEVTAVGEGVTDLKVGDRVAYAGAIGAYATERLAPAAQLVKLPSSISYETGAAMMLQGMTVQYLLRRTYKIDKNTTLLMHAAAGGIGLIACQWAKHLGATTIGTAGSDEKCKLAKAAGATHVINYRTENFVERVKEITGGKKCDVVYDSIGKDTFPGSLDCIKPLGLFVTFGNASGPIDAFNPGILNAKGSLYMTRPSLGAYTSNRADLLATANDLFEVVGFGRGKDQRQSQVRAEGCRAGAHGSRGPQDHGLDYLAACSFLSPRSPTPSATGAAELHRRLAISPCDLRSLCSSPLSVLTGRGLG